MPVAIGSESARYSVDAGFTGVVDADEDERFEGTGVDQLIGGAMDVPVLPSEGGGAIEKVLAVVKVEDREAAFWLLVVTGREIDDEVALVA